MTIFEITADDVRRRREKKPAHAAIVPDGGVVRVPARFMDARPRAHVMHAPGYVQITDADRAAREARIAARRREISNAWRDVEPVVLPSEQVAEVASLPGKRPTEDGVSAAHAAYQRRLETAYLNPHAVW